MLHYETEARGQPNSQSYRIYFSKSYKSRWEQWIENVCRLCITAFLPAIYVCTRGVSEVVDMEVKETFAC